MRSTEPDEFTSRRGARDGLNTSRKLSGVSDILNELLAARRRAHGAGGAGGHGRDRRGRGRKRRWRKRRGRKMRGRVSWRRRREGRGQ